MASESDIKMTNYEGGNILFSPEVVATIAVLATIEIKGVAGMVGGFADGVAEFLGKKNMSKGVKVEMTKDDATLDLFIAVDYGCVINEACLQVQAAVKNAVETMTGLNVRGVNVYVSAIKFPDEKTKKDKGEDTAQ